jgi:hypothetical protein
MAVFQSGPFNIEQGNSANFTVEFFDTSGLTSVPSSASMTVAYTTTTGSTQTDSVTLTNINSFFTGTWSSSLAALGLATWNALSAASSIQVASGQIRVIQRKAGP